MTPREIPGEIPGRDRAVRNEYVDEKGRRRWRRNDEIADKLRDLHDFLVIGGYDEVHASRYPRLALAISRSPQSIETLAAEGRLREFPGIAGVIEDIVQELIDRGTCKKFEDWSRTTPVTVLELTKIPGIGARTAKRLYQEHGIAGLADLDAAIQDGRLRRIRGFGPKKVDAISGHIEKQRRRPAAATKQAS